MQRSRMLSPALLRQLATARAGAVASAASSATSSSSSATASCSSSSCAAASSFVSPRGVATANTAAAFVAPPRTMQRVHFSSTARSSRPQTSRQVAAPAAEASPSASSSLAQVASFDNEFALGVMATKGQQRKAGRTGSPSEVPPLLLRSRKERRAEKKAQKKEAVRRKKSESIFGKAGLVRKKLSPFVREDAQFRTFKPITPSLRWVRQTVQPHVHKGQPVKRLTLAKRSTGGRNHHGKVTVRGRGGGNRTRIRIVDFLRREPGLQTVVRIERDPNRSAHIALIEHNETKAQSYILAPEGMRTGDTVESYRQGVSADSSGKSFESSSLDLGIFRTKAIRPGNVLPLRLIPIGTTVHAISLQPAGSAKLVRSAGSYGQIVSFVNRSKTKATPPGAGGSAGSMSGGPTPSGPGATSSLPGSTPEANDPSATLESSSASGGSGGGTPTTSHVQVRLQSGEVRLFPIGCCATIGRVSNADHEHERLGKAGRNRWRGRRPKVRGVAMNAVDHPHGGGRGKSKGNKHTRSIYGWKTKGPRTRKPGTRRGNRMVVRERPRMNGKRADKA